MLKEARWCVCIQVDASDPLCPIDVIDEIERSLGTPVQMVVKREDEQEFAKLNAENLMFL